MEIMMYLRNVGEGGAVTTALIKKDKKGMVSIKLMGYADKIIIKPDAGIKKKIEEVEMVIDEPKEIKEDSDDK